MIRAALAVVTVLMVVTAGCSTGGLQNDGTATPDGGPGDGSTPTATPTPTPSALPPGVSESGIENETALIRANKVALDETGYVWTARSNLTTRGDIKMNKVSRSTVRSEADAGAVYERHVTNDSIQGNTTTELWSDGTVTLIRDWKNTSVQREPKVQFRTAPSVDDAAVDRAGGAGTFLLIRLLQFEVTSQADGRVTLTATDVNRTAFEKVYGENGTVTDMEAELVVDTRGRIHAFDGFLDVEPGADTTTGVIDFISGTYRLETTGDVAVERPDWVSAAREAVPIVDVSIDVIDGTYVKVTNEGPDAIPAGVDVGLFEGSGGSLQTLEESVAPGETIYLYKPEDSMGPAIAREQPDEQARNLSGTYTVYVGKRVDNVLIRETITVEGS